MLAASALTIALGLGSAAGQVTTSTIPVTRAELAEALWICVETRDQERLRSDALEAALRESPEPRAEIPWWVPPVIVGLVGTTATAIVWAIVE
ncbi:MAG: hypothetical protein HC927_01230 [Deltaproteobacteria bacterium]|nr:hypothetical protein [Deltaproteobacteria bacterium]